MTALATFLAFLAMFTLVGISSAWRSTGTTDDYLVAGRSVPPLLTALSSVATNNSGFMFVGLIGFTVRGGLHTVWMAVAWILGDLLVWLFVHQRVRERSEAVDAVSVPTLLATGRDGVVQRPVVVVGAVLTFLFLGGYAAAQLDAGSTALEAMFGVPTWLGAVMGAAIVVAYCFSGGLRASIWTDAVQAVVMLGSMLLLLGYAMLEVGSPAALLGALEAQDPALLRLMPPDAVQGFVPYFLGFVAGGFGAVGQPHILVRSMAIESPSDIPRARAWYYAWFIPFYAAAILLALYARAILPELTETPTGLSPEAAQLAVVHATERALPALATELMPPALVGVMLAGLFSATMSTADSQMLSCSAAVTQDLFPSLHSSTWASKSATLAVAALALGLALWGSSGVFAMVLGAWSMLGASLGPVLLVRVLGRPAPAWLAVTMMLTGMGTVQLWSTTGLGGAIFDLLPGLAVPMAIYGMWSAARR